MINVEEVDITTKFSNLTKVEEEPKPPQFQITVEQVNNVFQLCKMIDPSMPDGSTIDATVYRALNVAYAGGHAAAASILPMVNAGESVPHAYMHKDHGEYVRKDLIPEPIITTLEKEKDLNSREIAMYVFAAILLANFSCVGIVLGTVKLLKYVF